MRITIDENSGFCFGVIHAIRTAEEYLQAHHTLYCLGDIVHNNEEVKRLTDIGLRVITPEQFRTLHDTTVLIRAHGEPPETYRIARENRIILIDATCPVVLHLQQRIRAEYESDDSGAKQIVIFGKPGHAEVLGLVGQTAGNAIVIENIEDASRLDFSRDISLYSQTTKPLAQFLQIVDYIKEHIAPKATFTFADTVCRQVANRMPHIQQFAARHDVILFVSGRKSSNGRVLFSECQRINPASYMVDSPEEINLRWFEGKKSVGICGATSTPKWLMEQCAERIKKAKL